MASQSLSRPFSCCFILSLSLLVLALAFNSSAPTVSAQTPPTPAGQATPPGHQRRLENRIPPHLPISAQVRNLRNERWVHDLEVVITNTSDRPIYYLKLLLMTPDIQGPTGNPYGFTLRYGRSALVDLEQLALPEDMPILPGESHTFTIPPLEREGWERFAAERNLHQASPGRVRLLFQVLSFGDGTGFMTTGGVRFPVPPTSRSPDQGRRQAGFINTIFNKSTCSTNSLLQPTSSSILSAWLPGIGRV